jgi:hypothetical protein
MYLAHATPASAPSFFSVLAHMHQAQALKGLLPPFSLFSSSSSRSISLLMAPSMEIKQSTQLQINCF